MGVSNDFRAIRVAPHFISIYVFYTGLPYVIVFGEQCAAVGREKSQKVENRNNRRVALERVSRRVSQGALCHAMYLIAFT